MKYLLDVNVLLAAIWVNHSRHAEAFGWLVGKSIVLCPLAELGFLRISASPKVFNAPMERARGLLRQFAQERKAERIDDDLAALDSTPRPSDEVTDSYLADLAGRHGLKLATFDERLRHGAVEWVSKRPPGQTSV